MPIRPPPYRDRRFHPVQYCLAALIGLVTWSLGMGGPLASVERFFLDARIRAFPVPPDPQIVIVDIDQQSLARRGEWPWRRSAHAALIDRLSRWGARLVLFDVLFTGPSGQPHEDAAFVRAVRRAGPDRVVLAGVWSGLAAREDGSIGTHLETPLLELRAPHGTADFVLDADGVVRRAPPLVREGEPCLALAGLRLLDPERARQAERRWSEGGSLLPLSGGPQSYPTVSYANVLDGVLDPRIDPALAPPERAHAGYDTFFRDRVVFVGASDLTLHDVFTTAATRGGALTPGVELQASLLAALRRDNLVRMAPPWADALLSTLLAALVAPALGLLPWRVGLGLSLAAGGLYALAAFGIYGGLHLAIGIGAPLVGLGLSLASLLTVTLWAEEREKQRVRSTFGRYVSPKVIEKILKDPDRYGSAGAERRRVTVLFMDLAGFTGFAEAAAPEQVETVLNAYLREMTACILAEEGILDKYIGDGIMAVWGSLGSTDPASDARSAMRAALAMQERLSALNEQWKAAQLPLLQARIGIHSGEALVGNFGSELQVNFTAVGDVVNSASRLEGLNKEFGTAILVSGETASLAGEGSHLRPLGSSAIRGRSGVLEVFELLAG